MQGIVAPVKALAPTIIAADKVALASFYTNFANIVVPNTGVAKSTEGIRNAHIVMSQESFQGRLKGKYPGLSEAVNKAIADALGLARRDLDDALRKRASETFQALAWAVGT
jgi:hypothetical protein